jgi:hypothetical protein
MVRLRSPECKGKVRFLGKGSCEQICHRTMLGEIASVQIVRACIVMLYDPRSYGFERSQLEHEFFEQAACDLVSHSGEFCEAVSTFL